MIHIVIYKLLELRIAPLMWYIWPVVTSCTPPDEKTEWVTVKTPLHESSSQQGHHIDSMPRRYLRMITIKWLCVTMYIPYMCRVENISKIYPANYDCHNDPEWREKYEQLCETDYFY